MRKITLHAIMRRQRDDEPVRIRHRGVWPPFAKGIPYETYGFLALCGEITSMGNSHMITDAERWQGENPDLICSECDHLMTLETLRGMT